MSGRQESKESGREERKEGRIGEVEGKGMHPSTEGEGILPIYQ